MTRYGSAAGAILITLVSAEAFAQGGPPRSTICHIPPGNPANGQTLTLPEPAIQTHLAHGDVMGACAAGGIRGNAIGGDRNDRPRNDGRGTPGRRGGSDERLEGGAREEADEAEEQEEEEAEEREGGEVSAGGGRNPGPTTTRPEASGQQPSGADRGAGADSGERGGKPKPGNTGGTGRGAPSTKKPAGPPRKQP